MRDVPVIVCIEGADGVGKSTQVKALRERLKYHGIATWCGDVPFEGFTKKIVYGMLRNGLAKKFPVTFQSIHFLNRLTWQTFELPRIAFDHDVVVIGRWSLSASIYGSLEGVPKTLLDMMGSWLLVPNFTVVIKGRVKGHDGDDVYERDELLQRRVEKAYDDACVVEPNTFIVRNDPDVNVVTQRIMDVLKLGNDEGESLMTMLGLDTNVALDKMRH